MSKYERLPMSKRLRFAILERDLFTCQYCGASAPDVQVVVDHIKPVATGGDNDPSNLTTACMECNQGKAAKELEPHDYCEGFCDCYRGEGFKTGMARAITTIYREGLPDLVVEQARHYHNPTPIYDFLGQTF